MKQTNNVIDERQQLINLKVCSAAGIFLALCLGVSTGYKLYTTGDIGWEFWTLLGACLVAIISRRVFGDIEQPKSIGGKLLPTGSGKADKKARKTDYTLRSLEFAVVCTVMDVLLVTTGKDEVTDYKIAETLFPALDKTATIILTAVISFVIAFIISYIFDYIVGENFKVKKYNKMIAELDGED